MNQALQSFWATENYPSCLNACVGENGGFNNDSWGYADGYIRGTIALIDSIKNINTDSIDTLIHPTVFLLRHGTELCIKHFIERLDQFGFPVKPRVQHSYSAIWQDFIAHYDHTPSSNNKLTANEIEWLGIFLKQLSALDIDGCTFRYPKANSGRKHLHGLVNLVNIGDLRDHTEKLNSIFRKCSHHLKVLADEDWRHPNTSSPAVNHQSKQVLP